MRSPLIRELRTVGWITLCSFVCTPILLWAFVTLVLRRDLRISTDYLDFYRAFFSLRLEDAVPAWLLVAAPAAIYEIGITAVYYVRHPEALRMIFRFPRRRG